MLSLFRQARAAGAVLLAASVLWLAGCVTLAPATPEEIVAQRCKERWAAMIEEDFDKAWTYAQPGFRAVVRQRDYANRFGGASQWKAVDVDKVTCEADRCTVRLRLTTKIMTTQMRQFMGKEIAGYIDETWVREESQWWYYQAL